MNFYYCLIKGINDFLNIVTIPVTEFQKIHQSFSLQLGTQLMSILDGYTIF